MDRDAWESKKYWIGLNMVLGVGKTLCHRLVKAFGSPKKVFHASRKELMEVERVGDKVARQILDFDLEQNLKREYQLAERRNVRILTLEDPEYPFLLKSIYDPPPVIYYKGTFLNERSIPLAVWVRVKLPVMAGWLPRNCVLHFRRWESALSVAWHGESIPSPTSLP